MRFGAAAPAVALAQVCVCGLSGRVPKPSSFVFPSWPGWLILALVGMSPVQAHAETRMGVLNDNYPFSFQEKNGATSGFACDLLTELEAVMGLRFQRVVGGTREIHAAFAWKEVDLLQTMSAFPEREDRADFSVPYLTMSGAIFVRAGEKDVHSLADLRGKKVLLHRGSLGEAVLLRAGLGDSIIEVASIDEALIKLGRGEGDATLVARLSGLALAHHLGVTNVRALSGDVDGYQVRYCVAVQDGDRELLAKVNEGLAVLVRTGRYDALYRKWFGAYVPLGYTERDVFAAVAAGLAIALAVALWAARKQSVLRRQIIRQTEILRISETRYRTVFEGASEGLIVMKRLGGAWLVEQINPAGRRMAESKNEAEPMSPLAIWFPNDPRFVEAVQVAAEGDGEREFEFERAADRGFWRVRIAPLGDKILLGLVDVSVSVRARLQLGAQEERLRQKQKLEAVGTLASGVSHDFNNLLTAIMGGIEITQIQTPADAPSLPHLGVAMKAAQRARDLVRQILTFSRQSAPRHELLRIAPLVDETLNLVKSLARGTVRFETSLSDDLPTVVADPVQVHQVLMNLCTNAVQAMQGRPGRLGIRALAIDTDAEVQAQLPELKPGRYVRVDVQDDGPGMSPTVVARIFDPFFTTKKTGEGTGLGLSVVHGIMQQHGGAVAVYSQPGRGTVFQVYFPVAEKEAAKEWRVSDAGMVPGGRGERVLLIDDDEAVAEAASRIMEFLGYHVTSHLRAEAAWAEFQASRGEFALVVSDLTMPETTGLTLLARIRAERSAVPFVLMSGFFSEAERIEAERLQVSVLLPKPLSLVALREAAAKALGKAGAVLP